MSAFSYNNQAILQQPGVLSHQVPIFEDGFVPKTQLHQDLIHILRQTKRSTSAPRLTLEMNNEVVLGGEATGAQVQSTSGAPLPQSYHVYKPYASLDCPSNHQRSDTLQLHTQYPTFRKQKLPKLATILPTMSVQENSDQSCPTIVVTSPSTDQETEDHAPSKDASIGGPTFQGTPPSELNDIIPDDSHMLLCSHVTSEESDTTLSENHATEQSTTPPTRRSSAAPEQQHFHYTTAERFKALHVYKCLKHPEHIRFHLNNWEQHSAIDSLVENTDQPTGDDDEIPTHAEFVIVAEEMICEPHFGSALFFASKNEATHEFTLHVGFYYSFERMTHTSLPSLQQWADGKCGESFTVLEKSEVLRWYGPGRQRFMEVYGRCGKAVDAEFRDRNSGKKWALWLGPQRRCAFRRRRTVLDQ